MGVSGQRHAPAALYNRERTPVSIGQEAGWTSELVWTQRLEEKSFTFAELLSSFPPAWRQRCSFIFFIISSEKYSKI
jgi:hypothetical protein